NRYETINNLNDSWGTVYWSQVYNHWEEIFPPNLTVTSANPSQLLDYYRFSSDSFNEFVKLQTSIIRQFSENQFVTHNPELITFEVNTHKLRKNLDFLSANSFPTGQAEMLTKKLYAPWENIPEFSYDVGDPYITGFLHSWVRGARN